MLLIAPAAASRIHLLRSRRVGGGGGGGGAPPTFAVGVDALTGPQLRSLSSSFSCACSPLPSPGDDGKDGAPNLFDESSILSPVIPWEVDDIWRTYAGYFFIVHMPLSFGGLGVVAKVLNCSSLNPMTTVISTITLQLVELTLALSLLQYTAIPGHDVQAYFVGKVSTQRNWINAAVLGFGLLMTLVLITSIVADKLIGPEDAYDPTLKDILSDSPTSKLLCFVLYSVVAPLSEETIYRGFLLTALSSSMKMRDAIMISSLVFSVAHLSGASFIQLFVVGCITGLAYCRTGTLVSSFTIHSLYNAAILFMALLS
ncbi:hypothetical protein EJB05_12833 [Eragrostis curvula]|uniref:CAAX prenyl protease 2/Lysostaphin resistance protein A-like domain-containing protein n=1 Tax=Eragrostis curvula TaxID=38414 RepID=A0A5J9VV04_9POAL|nr:hypothetical protein EJB05_12833 [Eragrostis curvula]